MAEAYDSVIDRLGAFNAATEKMAKGKASRVECSATAPTACRLRLVKTEEHYAFEVDGDVPPGRDAALLELHFAPAGTGYRRDIRRAERSWNVANEMEDILADVFGLPPDTSVTVVIE